MWAETLFWAICGAAILAIFANVLMRMEDSPTDQEEFRQRNLDEMDHV